MAKRDQVENTEVENTEVENPEVAADPDLTAAPEAAVADEPIEPGEVKVENAVSEDQLREKVRRMLKGRKSYELCGILKASPSAISNFTKGKGGLTKQMLAGLGVRPVLTYVIDDPEKFNSTSV